MKNRNTKQWVSCAASSIFLAGILLESWIAFAGSSVHQIRIEHVAPYFSPNSVTVSAGTLIRWENDTGEAHTIIADECVRGSRCRFDSGIIRPHERYDLLALPPGRYTYHCGLHPFMRGTITVVQPQRNTLDI